MPWSGQFLYAFPLFSLIGKVLEKVKTDKACVLLIAPAWSWQHWYGTFLGLLVTPPWPLPLHPDLLSQDQGHLRHPPFYSVAAQWLDAEEARCSEGIRHVLAPSLPSEVVPVLQVGERVAYFPNGCPDPTYP